MPADQFHDLGSESPLPEEPIEKLILQSMNEGVITLECNGTIYTANPAAYRLLGLDDGELHGKHLDQALSWGPANEEFRKFFARALSGEAHAEQAETRFKRRDGQVVDLSVTSSYLEVDVCTPGLENVVVVFRDVTALKSLERAVRRAVNHLSHELMTPLSVILGSVDSMLKREPSRADLDRGLRRIQRHVQRLTDIQGVVQGILEPPPYRPRCFDAKRAIPEIISTIREEAAHRAVTLHTRIEVDETDRIDPDFLPTILRTLVKNAIENAPDGGEVIVSLRRTYQGDLLEVTDTGVGIALQDEPFILEGLHYTQPTEEYSTKKPYDFNAGGKGLELLRLKVFSETAGFRVRFTTRRCAYLTEPGDRCPGLISACSHAKNLDRCREAGGTTFAVLFPRNRPALRSAS